MESTVFSGSVEAFRSDEVGVANPDELRLEEVFFLSWEVWISLNFSFQVPCENVSNLSHASDLLGSRQR